MASDGSANTTGQADNRPSSVADGRDAMQSAFNTGSVVSSEISKGFYSVF
jgi:hypothetical protein